MKSWILSAACLGVLACGSWALAQDNDPANRRSAAGQDPRVESPRRGTPEANAQREANLEQLAGWLATCNQAEIELSKLALERAQNDQVKQYAQRMIEDHTKFLNELRQFMPAIDTETSGREAATADRVTERRDTPSADRPARTPRANAGDRAQAAKSGHGEMMQIGMKASQLKLAMLKQILEEQQGQDFDMGYLGQQIVGHVELLATLKAMQGHGTPEFQQVLAQGTQATEGHLKQARGLAMKLEDKEAGTQADAPTRGSAPQRQ